MCDEMGSFYNNASTTPPKPEAERCGTCRFWKASGQRMPRGYPQPGRCRRRAPSAVHRFPETASGGWCGEWQPRQ